MKRLLQISILLTMSTLLSSCIKEELPVPARDPGDATVVQVCTGPTYRAQTWYDIGTNSVVSTNNKEVWDIAFGWEQNQAYLVLNAARRMRAAVSSENQLNSVTDTLALSGQFKVDTSSGDLNGLAVTLGDAGDKVIVLDMGYDHYGLPMGMYKMRIATCGEQSAHFEFSELNGTGSSSLTVDRDHSTNLSYASLITQQQRIIEPPIGTYDLVFTQYTFQFDVPVLDYIVNGTLLARSGVRAAQIDGAQFENVMLRDTVTNPMSTVLDVIGFDWKEYDFDLSVYTVDPTKIFIVQDTEGLFYKIHFTDFYNDQGQKGCPEFELVAF